MLAELYRIKGLEVPEFLDYTDYDEAPVTDMDETVEREKQPSGFFSKIALAFGIGAGVHQGITNAAGTKLRRFRVGDRVRVRYRGQEGTVIDINGDLYMVSLNDGGYVDSYTENQLERSW